MEYILVMSLSGSTMMGFYLLLKYLLREKVSFRLHYLILRLTVMFYLIPLPFLRVCYRNIIQAFMPEKRMKSVQILVAWTNSVVHVGPKTFANTYTVVQIIAAGLWMFVVCILMARWILKYVWIRKQIAKYTGTVLTEKQRFFLEGLKKKYGVRRPVFLYQGQDGDQTMTFGICSPAIVCSREIGGKEAEMLVSHELLHIRRLDVLWKLLVRFVVILHWWNPIARKLRSEFERVCEYSCDEITIQGKTGDEVKVYFRLLIEETCIMPEMGLISAGWQNSFTDNIENIKERMENLMKKKKWNCYVAGVLVTVLAFCNSMTVFAYRDTLHQCVPDNTSQEEVTQSLQSDIFFFMPDEAEMGKSESVEEVEVLYEKQFIDTEGEIYSYTNEETETTYRSCSHDFVSGTASEHTKKADGGCEVREYRAQRCSKCGYVVRGEKIRTIIYDVCPH